jgi:hypothetical protein
VTKCVWDKQVVLYYEIHHSIAGSLDIYPEINEGVTIFAKAV